MNHCKSLVADGPYLLKVGEQLYPICGDSQRGWRWADDELLADGAVRFPYRSIEELFFALLNFSLTKGGSA